MSRKMTRLILSIGLIMACVLWCLPDAIAQENKEAAEDSTTVWGKFGKYIIPAIAIFLFASANYAIRLFSKDKILKKLLKKYVVFEINDDAKTRYRGTMRLEEKGVEIISEESRQRGHAPSYIFRAEEAKNIVAFIRYLDSMNERERIERDWDFERVHHPRFPTRMRRKIRNFGIALTNSVNNTIETIWGSIKNTLAIKTITAQGVSAADVEEAKKQLQQATEERYERLIERLVGTRVKVKTHTGEYIGVLTEYTKEYMYLMDVKQPDGKGYKDSWAYTRDVANLNYRDERGLRCKLENDYLIFENNAAYDILLGDVVLKEESEPYKQEFKYQYRIPAFTVQRLPLRPGPIAQKVAPFENVVTRKNRTWRNFKKIELNFASYREADIAFLRGAATCRIIEGAEKYQPEQFDIGGLAETLSDTKEATDVEFKDKDGNLIRGINIVAGYITNVNEDRIDIKAVDHNYGQRWSVEHAFEAFDSKLRTIGSPAFKISPLHRSRMAAQTMLVSQVEEKKAEQSAMAPMLYTPIAPHIKPYKKPELPIKVLALTGNITESEFPVLQQFESIRQHRIIYEPTENLKTDGIAKTHILWMGHGEIYKEGYRLSIDDEHRIKDFVRRGGVVIVSGQDVRDIQKRRRGLGWTPEPLMGVEYDETLEFTPTRHGKKSRIFQTPHKILSGQIKLDDMWHDELNRYIPLATANGGDEAAMLQLPFQEGLYIVTSLKNETDTDVQVNQPMMENLLYFSVKWLDQHKHTRLYYTSS